MSGDFDFVSEGGRTWRYVERLADDERDRGLSVLEQRQAADRRRLGLPPVGSASATLLHCGHSRKLVQVDGQGVTICPACERDDVEASRG